MLTFLHLFSYVLFFIGLSFILFSHFLYDPNKLLIFHNYDRPVSFDQINNFSKSNLYEKRVPSVIIIGVKKCGTRALLHFLKIHPKIKVIGPEIHFFDRKQIYEKGIQWYIKQMPLSRPDQITIEKTPSYFVTPGVPARIRRMSKRVKLLVVVRDPAIRALSDYVQASSKRSDTTVLGPLGTGRTFESFVFDKKPLPTPNVVPNSSIDYEGPIDTTWSAIRLGLYSRYLVEWVPHFDLRNDMLFVDGERLINDPAAVVAEVESFLGLPSFVNRDMFVYDHPSKGFPCLKGNPVNCLGQTKGRPHPVVSQRTMQRLHQFYRPFNFDFFKMINRTFDWG